MSCWVLAHVALTLFIMGWGHEKVSQLTQCSLVTEYRISKRVSEQFDAFMSGFNELIPQELINVFDERELEVSCPSRASSFTYIL